MAGLRRLSSQVGPHGVGLRVTAAAHCSHVRGQLAHAVEHVGLVAALADGLRQDLLLVVARPRDVRLVLLVLVLY